MNLRPLYDQIIVKRIEAETTTKSGLIIPDSAKEKPAQGHVIAVGNGKRNADGKMLTLEVAVGDRVLFGKYSGTDVKIDGEEHTIMRESDIMAIVETKE